MNQGKIIEYIDEGRFVSALCLQDKGNRLHLLISSNRQVNLSPKRAVLILGPNLDTLRPREELLDKLREAERTRSGLKERINVRELWDLIRDEKESLDNRYLAQLVFGEDITDDHLSALVRALFEDHLYFKMKDGRFFPNSEERVEQIIKQKEEEAAKEEILTQGGAWLKQIRQGQRPEEPSGVKDIISLLVRLALYGNEDPDYKYGKELLSRAGISDLSEIRGLLISLGVWEEDENIDLIRSGIKTSFAEDQLDESALLARAEVGFQDREDLRELNCFTIDGPLTLDYDDALSLELKGGVLHLGIHISDVATNITPGSLLDLEARDRASSLYLPRKHIPMIPPDLSQDALSLKEGCDRGAVSLLARLDRGGELIDYRFVPSVIRVQRQLTYEEADLLLEHEDGLREIHQLCHRLGQRRGDQGAISLSLPDLQVKISEDSLLSLAMIDQNTPSRKIVSEMMIFYNWLTARFCLDNGIPLLFRSQAEPSERISQDESGYLYYIFCQRRKLSPLRINTVPNPHSGLGLDVYTQSTSPIRRYLDLVIQRQMLGFLAGNGPAYDQKALEEISLFVQPVLRDLENIKRGRIRYWILKFLMQNMDAEYRALIFDELKTKYRVVLKDFFLVAEIKRKNGTLLRPGDEIIVKIKKVDPWEDVLELSYVN